MKRPKTPEQRERLIQKLIASPPSRIRPERVRARKAKSARTYPSKWLRDIWREQHGNCFYCKLRMEYMTIDHKVPLSRGGKTERRNVVGACEPCNTAKGSLMPEDFDPAPVRAFRLGRINE